MLSKWLIDSTPDTCAIRNDTYTLAPHRRIPETQKILKLIASFTYLLHFGALHVVSFVNIPTTMSQISEKYILKLVSEIGNGKRLTIIIIIITMSSLSPLIYTVANKISFW